MRLELLGGMFDGKIVDVPFHVVVLEVPHEVHLPKGTIDPRLTPYPEKIVSRYVVLANKRQARFEGESRKA